MTMDISPEIAAFLGLQMEDLGHILNPVLSLPPLGPPLGELWLGLL